MKYLILILSLCSPAYAGITTQITNQDIAPGAVDPSKTSNGILSGSSTSGQVPFYQSSIVLTSTVGFSFSGNTLRIGTLNRSVPAGDVHLFMGSGARAYNFNLSEDPVYLELGNPTGASFIGYSQGGTQLMRLGLSASTNWIAYDDDIPGGLGTELKYAVGTGHWTFGNPSSGESGIATPSVLATYGSFTIFGNASPPAASGANNGELYFNSNAEHFQASENGGSFNSLALFDSNGLNTDISSMSSVKNIGGLYFNYSPHQVSIGTNTFTYRLNVNGSIGIFNPANNGLQILISSFGFITAQSSVTASVFVGSGTLLTGIIHTGDSAGGDLSGTYPNPTVPQLGTLGISTAANSVAITTNSAVIAQLSLSTANLAAVKASTGTNSDIYELKVVNTMDGPFTVSAGSVTVKNDILSFSSITGNQFGNGFGLANITQSSCTSILNTTFSNTSFGPAISTVTISNIRAGSHVLVKFSGQATNGTAADGIGVTILQDGAFTVSIGSAAIAGFTNSALPTTPATQVNLGFSVVLDTPALSAGSHSWAFAPAVVTGGTGTLIKTGSVNNRFCVTEEP